jgi:hypothetical protein
MAVGVRVGVKSKQDKSGRGMNQDHNLSEEQNVKHLGQDSRTHFVIRYTVRHLERVRGS